MGAECLGTAVLVATVVGSGIMATNLTNDTAIQLLGNTLPTGAILYALITILGPVSGAHFNPAVTVIMTIKGETKAGDALSYIIAQILGGIIGTIIAHAMFDMPLIALSTKFRTGNAQWFAEFIATAGLLLTILLGVRHAPHAIAKLVSMYIIAAYWFTASTSFANPAVTIARSLTNTFSGIAPVNTFGFIIVQLVGAFAGLMFAEILLKPDEKSDKD